jgi:aspartate aminotransferase
MAVMDKREELDSLREQVRERTAEIIRSVHNRMELSKRIGEIKSGLALDVKDEKVEQEITSMVSALADGIGMNQAFALRLLNILLDESESVQVIKRDQKQKQTHLGVFMKAKQLEASGKEIIHMEVGEPDYSPPAAVGQSLAESFRLRQYHYTDTRGVPNLRDAIAKRLGVREEQIIVTPGGRFAVFSAIASLLKAGQELIVVEPAWPAYEECASFIGARTRFLKTRLEDRWEPDTRILEGMINAASGMIVLNYPNNPTGKVLDSRTMDKIVSIAKDHGLYLLSDEVYAEYTFNGVFKSIIEYDFNKSIMVSSFSKRHAMTGFRVGYSVAANEIVTKMARVQAVGITSVAEPMQRAALAALPEDHSENVRIMKTRLDFITSRLKAMSLRFVEPDGAMYVYPQLRASTDFELVEKLLERGVAIAPGSGFGESYKAFIRISACQPTELLGKGLEIMAKVIREQ